MRLVSARDCSSHRNLGLLRGLSSPKVLNDRMFALRIRRLLPHVLHLAVGG